MASSHPKTVVKTLTCETTLKMDNVYELFTACNKRPMILKSSNFNAGAEDENNWRMIVSIVAGRVDVEVCNTTKQDCEEAWISISIIDFDYRGNEYKRGTETLSNYSEGQQPNKCYFKGYLKYITFLNNPKLHRELFPDGNLTLHCGISTVATIKQNAERKQMITSDSKQQTTANNLEDDLAKLLSDGKFSDVAIAVEKREIKAHKNILAARSPVFAAMFESAMQENLQNRVNICDLDYDVVQEMLNFIYTGRAPANLGIMADRLLTAADKYALTALKTMCEEELSGAICVDKVTELMALADLHNATGLKRRIDQFIETNIKELMKHPSWSKMIYDRSFKKHSGSE